MVILLLTIVIALQLTIFHKLKKTIMGAQAVTQATMEAILALVSEAFNTNVGDLTTAEAEAQDAEFRARMIEILGGTPPPPTP